MSLARVRAMVVLGSLVLLAVVAAGWAIAKDSETGPVANGIPCVQSTVPFVTTVPAKPGEVRVNVYNATSRIGLATEVADQLRMRGFSIDRVGNDPLESTVSATAEIRYGPAGAGAAQLLRAQFPGSVTRLVQRSDAQVDVALGMLYESVATEAQYRDELDRLGAPTPPPELCKS